MRANGSSPTRAADAPLVLLLILAAASFGSESSAEEGDDSVPGVIREELPPVPTTEEWLSIAATGDPDSQRRAVAALACRKFPWLEPALKWRDSGFFAGPEECHLSPLLGQLVEADLLVFLSDLELAPERYAGLFAYSGLLSFPEFDQRFLAVTERTPSVAGARLVRLGDPNAANQLISDLGSPNSETRVSALNWLRIAPPTPGEWTRRLVSQVAVMDPGPELEFSLATIARHGVPSDTSLAPLRELVLDAKRADAIAEAARCLAVVDPAQFVEVARKMPLLSEPSQEEVLLAFAELGTEATLDLVVQLADDSDPRLCQVAADLLVARSNGDDGEARLRILRAAFVRSSVASLIASSLPSVLADLTVLKRDDVSALISLVATRERLGQFVPLSSTSIAITAADVPLLVSLTLGASDRHERARDVAEMLATSRGLLSVGTNLSELLTLCEECGGEVAQAAVLYMGAAGLNGVSHEALNPDMLTRALRSKRPVVRRYGYMTVQTLHSPRYLGAARAGVEAPGTPLWVEALRAQVASGMSPCDAVSSVLNYCVDQLKVGPYLVLEPWITQFLTDQARGCEQLHPIMRELAGRCMSWPTYELLSALAGR